MNKRKKEYAVDVLKREIEARKTKLKPCPFCNGEAEVDYRLGLCSVVCKDCGARVSSFGDVNPAIKAWNKRVDVAKTDESIKDSCKDLPNWYYSEWNHQFKFSTCTIYISQFTRLDFTIRRLNIDLNTDKWEAHSELVDCIHDSQLSKARVIFGVSRQEAIEKCESIIKQMGNGFLELYNRNRKVKL